MTLLWVSVSALLLPSLTALLSPPPCSFLCGDGLTCVASHQVCDDSPDCPAHSGGEGGEDEAVCGASQESQEEEEEGNTVDRGVGGEGRGQDIFTLCLEAQTALVADPSDCHTFYHCSESLPVPQSCGFLMFHPVRQTCDWPRTVMQVRPDCQDASRLRFRLGPKSWDSKRTHRMLSWLGDRVRPRVQDPLHRPRRIQVVRYPVRPQAPVFIQRQEHQRRRIALAAPGIQHIHQSQEPQYSQEAEYSQEPHYSQEAEYSQEPHYSQEAEYSQEPQYTQKDYHGQAAQYPEEYSPEPQYPQYHPQAIPAPEAPRPHVVRLEPGLPANRILSRPSPVPVSRVPVSPVPVSPVPVSSVFSVSAPRTRAQDLTEIISNQIQQRIRERIPIIISNLSGPVSLRLGKSEPEPVERERVTHTVTSTTSQVSAAGPSHHYVQETVIGDGNDSEEAVEEEEEEEEIVPKLSPILVENMRDNKPVWTVTRERPRQILARPMKSPGKMPRVLKKVRRKLIQEEMNKLEERRRVLLKKGKKQKQHQEEKYQDYQDQSYQQEQDHTEAPYEHLTETPYEEQTQDRSPPQPQEQYEDKADIEYDDQTYQEYDYQSNRQHDFQPSLHHANSYDEDSRFKVHANSNDEDDNQAHGEEGNGEAEVPRLSLGLSNSLEEKGHFDDDEKRAISLKQAFDMAINRVGVASRHRAPGSRVHDIIVGDSQARKYVDSAQIREIQY